jgi:hypothetical protein
MPFTGRRWPVNCGSVNQPWQVWRGGRAEMVSGQRVDGEVVRQPRAA